MRFNATYKLRHKSGYCWVRGVEFPIAIRKVQMQGVNSVVSGVPLSGLLMHTSPVFSRRLLIPPLLRFYGERCCRNTMSTEPTTQQ